MIKPVIPKTIGPSKWKQRSGRLSDVREMTTARTAAKRYGGAVSKRLYVSGSCAQWYVRLHFGHAERGYDSRDELSDGAGGGLGDNDQSQQPQLVVHHRRLE